MLELWHVHTARERKDEKVFLKEYSVNIRIMILNPN